MIRWYLQLTLRDRVHSSDTPIARNLTLTLSGKQLILLTLGLRRNSHSWLYKHIIFLTSWVLTRMSEVDFILRMRSFNLLTIWDAVIFSCPLWVRRALQNWFAEKRLIHLTLAVRRVPLTRWKEKQSFSWRSEYPEFHSPDTPRNSSLFLRTDFADFTHLTAREQVNAHTWLSK
jgi:hypothetical protein